jgi:hypothetical protein
LVLLEIRESQIEDIFATQLDDVREMLSIKSGISLINRQKRLPSGGILDLLFISSTNIHLLELKAIRSEKKDCDQVLGYKEEVEFLQGKREMPNLPVIPYLVCPDFLSPHIDYCREKNVVPIQYSPYELLKNYYSKVSAIARLVEIKPSNHGLWNLHLLNRILYSMSEKTSIEKLPSSSGLSKSSVGSYLRLSSELGLTRKDPLPELKEMGKEYVKRKQKDGQVDFLSDEQVELLKNYIVKNPFVSPAIFGIYSAVETVFILSKNFYPAPLSKAVNLFATLSGKESEWAAKARKDAFTMYSNYSVDLGLLAKIGQDYYITPAGVKFILLTGTT